ncbi:hypothetical protein CP532_4081 [Ophiocordyceps camponoti-leonardi (nom. inval.)]|nr:hypothetical protein CP532_4081 [Ophiocordyceps camponoti-leonardi (nom. inval.)]
MKSLSILLLTTAATLSTATPLLSNRPQPKAVTDADIINACKESGFEREQCIRFHAQCSRPVFQHEMTLEDCKADFESKEEKKKNNDDEGDKVEGEAEQEKQPSQRLTDQDVESFCRESSFGREQCIQFHAKCFRPVYEGRTTLEECKADFLEETPSK